MADQQEVAHQAQKDARHTHLAEEFLDSPVDIVVRVLELADDGLGCLGESHGGRFGDWRGVGGREGLRNRAEPHVGGGGERMGGGGEGRGVEIEGR